MHRLERLSLRLAAIHKILIQNPVRHFRKREIFKSTADVSAEVAELEAPGQNGI